MDPNPFPLPSGRIDQRASKPGRLAARILLPDEPRPVRYLARGTTSNPLQYPTVTAPSCPRERSAIQRRPARTVPAATRPLGRPMPSAGAVLDLARQDIGYDGDGDCDRPITTFGGMVGHPDAMVR